MSQVVIILVSGLSLAEGFNFSTVHNGVEYIFPAGGEVRAGENLLYIHNILQAACLETLEEEKRNAEALHRALECALEGLKVHFIVQWGDSISFEDKDNLDKFVVCSPGDTAKLFQSYLDFYYPRKEVIVPLVESKPEPAPQYQPLHLSKRYVASQQIRNVLFYGWYFYKYAVHRVSRMVPFKIVRK